MHINEILNQLAMNYKNVVKTTNNTPVYNHTFKVVDSIGNESAEIFYSSEFHEWAIILDNFPSRRKHYSWTLPIKDFQTLEYLLKLGGVDLIEKPKH